MSDDPLIAQAESTTKVSSALTPALILAGSSLAGGLAGLKIAPEELAWLFAALSVGGPIFAALQIVFFTVADRDRLHSEKYLEKKLLISKIEPQLGDANNVIEIEPVEKPTPNPKALEDGNV